MNYRPNQKVWALNTNDMKLHEKKFNELADYLAPYLSDLIKDYREDMDEENAKWFISRVNSFLHNKKWVTENHFFETCRYIVENYTTFRTINVAVFKTAFSKLFDK